MIDDLTALRLQLEWGVDEVLGDGPFDRFAPTRPAPPRPLDASGPASVQASPAPARSIAPAARTLDALHAELDALTTCPLRATATNTVRPSGSSTASVLMIADAPGNEDDRSGQSFSGPQGEVVDRVMASIGLDRTGMLLTTLVPWRPPGNRPVSETELQVCLPYLHRLIGLVQPRVIVLVGAGPAVALTGQAGTIRQLRGRWLELAIPTEQITVQALAILPFAQWLRDGSTKQQLWSDLQLLREPLTTG